MWSLRQQNPTALNQATQPLRAGFTLIEVLVVLSICALLAAILLPTYSLIKGKAEATTCSSNLRQIYLALDLYAEDYGGTYPRLGEFNDDPNCSLWADSVFPYVKSPGVFWCPAYDAGEYRPGCPPTENPGQVNEIRYDGSYDLNNPNVTFETNDKDLRYYTIKPHSGVRISQYTRPSSTILALDGDGFFVNPGTQEPPFEGTDGLLKYGVNPRHANGCNLVFADGHLKWLALASLTQRSLWTLNGPE